MDGVLEAQRAQHEEIERICRVGVKEYQKTADTVRRGAPRPKGSKRRTASDCGHCALRPPKPAVYHCYGPPTAVISCLYAYPPNTSAPPQHLLVASLSAAACLPLRQVPLPGAFSSSSCAYCCSSCSVHRNNTLCADLPVWPQFREKVEQEHRVKRICLVRACSGRRRVCGSGALLLVQWSPAVPRSLQWVRCCCWAVFPKHIPVRACLQTHRLSVPHCHLFLPIAPCLAH